MKVDGREIIQEQQKILEEVKEVVSNTNMIIGGIKGGIELQTRIDQENKKLNLEDQILFGDFIVELSKSQAGRMGGILQLCPTSCSYEWQNTL